MISWLIVDTKIFLFCPQISMNVKQAMPSVRRDSSAATRWAATNVFVLQVSQAQSVRQVSKQALAYVIKIF